MIINTLLALLLAVTLGWGSVSAMDLQSVSAPQINVEQVSADEPISGEEDEGLGEAPDSSEGEEGDDDLDSASYPASHTYTFEDEADEL